MAKLTPEQLKPRLQDTLDMWETRNQTVTRIRSYLFGHNKVKMPETAMQKVAVQHDYLWAAAVQEKAARFRHHPSYQVVNQVNSKGIVSESERRRSSTVERGLNNIFYEMEREQASWDPLVKDVIAFEMGGERIEPIYNTRWSKLVSYKNEAGEDTDELAQDYDDDKKYQSAKARYKRAQGVPFRAVYVPVDCLYPIYNGSVLSEVFEMEERRLSSVLSNPMFKGSEIHGIYERDSARVNQMLTVVHHCDEMYHCYYAIVPVRSRSYDPTPVTGTELAKRGMGMLIPLGEYVHGAGMPIYNIANGAEGGWAMHQAEIEGRFNALLDLNEDADEKRTLLATYVRSNTLLTWKHKVSPTNRDSTNSPPKPPEIQEGMTMSIWADEELTPLVDSRDITPLVKDYEFTINRFEHIAGARSLYGQHEPGVNTGYHEEFRVEQAEHIDRRIETGLAMAGINRARILIALLKHKNEPVPIQASVKLPGAGKAGEYLTLHPKMLDPFPVIDVAVRIKRSGDTAQQLNNSLRAREDGPMGPLYDDYTILERFMGEEHPEEILMARLIQSEKAKAIEAGAISEAVQQKFRLKAATTGTATMTPEDAALAGPAFLDAANQAILGGQVEGAGGLAPETATSLLAGRAANQMPPPEASSINGQGGGTPTGYPQDPNVMANTERLMGQ